MTCGYDLKWPLWNDESLGARLRVECLGIAGALLGGSAASGLEVFLLMARSRVGNFQNAFLDRRLNF